MFLYASSVINTGLQAINVSETVTLTRSQSLSAHPQQNGDLVA